MTDINLQHVSIDEAMNGRVWTAIQDSWTEDDKIKKCVSVCRDKKKDKFIKEKL